MSLLLDSATFDALLKMHLGGADKERRRVGAPPDRRPLVKLNAYPEFYVATTLTWKRGREPLRGMSVFLCFYFLKQIGPDPHTKAVCIPIPIDCFCLC